MLACLACARSRPGFGLGGEPIKKLFDAQAVVLQSLAVEIGWDVNIAAEDGP